MKCDISDCLNLFFVPNKQKIFKQFLTNIKISDEKAGDISYRYGRITKSLNQEFREIFFKKHS